MSWLCFLTKDFFFLKQLFSDMRFILDAEGKLKCADVVPECLDIGFVQLSGDLVIPNVTQTKLRKVETQQPSPATVMDVHGKEATASNGNVMIKKPKKAGFLFQDKASETNMSNSSKNNNNDDDDDVIEIIRPKRQTVTSFCSDCGEKKKMDRMCQCSNKKVASDGSSKRKGRQPQPCSRCGKPKRGDLDVCVCKAEKKKKKKKVVAKPAAALEPVWPVFVPEPQPDNEVRPKMVEGGETVVYMTKDSDMARLYGELTVCGECGSFEEQSYLITCFNCAQSYHRFCLSMRSNPDLDSWKCPYCKGCEVCHHSGHEDKLLVCEKCDCGYHTFCLDPPLGFIPMGDWICPEHAECKSCGTKTAGSQPQHMWHENDTLCHLCWVRIRDQNQCPSCLRAYDPDDWDCSFMVGCDCGRWVHRGCDGITHALYDEFQKPERKDAVYNCVVCRAVHNKPKLTDEELIALLDPELEAAPKEEEHKPTYVVDMRDDEISEEVKAVFRCAFCGRGPESCLWGRMLPVSKTLDAWVHVVCALWASRVETKRTGEIFGVEMAIDDSKVWLCEECHLPGAVVTCKVRTCSKKYHLPCVVECGVPLVKPFACKEHCDPSKAPIALGLEARMAQPARIVSAAEKQAAKLEAEKEEQSWDTKIKEFIAQNASAFLNQKYDEKVADAKNSVERLKFECVANAIAHNYTMQCGTLQVVSFGTIRSSPVHFHSCRLLFPVGFKAIRRFWSYKTPNTKIRYENSIETVDGLPVFKIVPQDDRMMPVIGDTPSEAWKEISSRFAPDNARGVGDMCWREDMFGLPGWVGSAMEAMAGANTCINYHFQHWKRMCGNTLGGQVDHALGCARAIPYERTRSSRKQGNSAFVYNKIKDSSNSNQNNSATAAIANSYANTRETPDFVRYRHLQQHPPKLVVHKSGIHGMGVYTLSHLKKGDMVIEYQGEIIRPIVADKREKDYEKRGIPCYLWKLTEDKIVDATFCGNMARFINHNHDPNCVVDIANVSGSPKVMISAKRDIVPGEELTYDYMFDGTEEDNVVCDCGSYNCPGLMTLPPLNL